jgi:hypothetical protein
VRFFPLPCLLVVPKKPWLDVNHLGSVGIGGGRFALLSYFNSLLAGAAAVSGTRASEPVSEPTGRHWAPKLGQDRGSFTNSSAWRIADVGAVAIYYQWPAARRSNDQSGPFWNGISPGYTAVCDVAGAVDTLKTRVFGLRTFKILDLCPTTFSIVEHRVRPHSKAFASVFADG